MVMPLEWLNFARYAARRRVRSIQPRGLYLLHRWQFVRSERFASGGTRVLRMLQNLVYFLVKAPRTMVPIGVSFAARAALSACTNASQLRGGPTGAGAGAGMAGAGAGANPSNRRRPRDSASPSR